MPALADRRVSIRAEDLGDTEDPRELTGNRHQQDAEHEQYLQDYGGANRPSYQPIVVLAPKA